MRKIIYWFVFLCAPLCLSYGMANSRSEDGVQKVQSVRSIEREGERLCKLGYYDQALEVFKKADAPEYRLHKNGFNDYARSHMRAIYLAMGDYQAGLDSANEVLAIHPTARANLEAKAMFESLIASKLTGTYEPVYQFIADYRAKNANNLPPLNYKFTSSWEASTILRLYDTIGDHDAGIAFIDEILAYFRTGKAGDPKPGRVDEEYIKIRNAFELDKKEGTKGRATKALIQSDYFPW